MPNIYVVNKSGHDYSDAYRFGDRLIYLSEGQMPRYELNQMFRQFEERLRESSPYDCLLPCSLNNMNIVAAAMMVSKHKKLRLLLWQKDRYMEQVLDFTGVQS